MIKAVMIITMILIVSNIAFANSTSTSILDQEYYPAQEDFSPQNESTIWSKAIKATIAPIFSHFSIEVK